MTTRTPWARAAVAAIVVTLAGAAAPAADAHVRTGVIAVDFRAEVPTLRPRVEGVTARVYASDRALGLTVGRTHAVVVVGYFREPFLRIDGRGVAVNAHSTTAAAAGLLRNLHDGTGTWRLRSTGRTIVWHDTRLTELELAPGADKGRWTVPLVVDGTRVRLEGVIRRIPAPPPWPWFGAGAPLAAAAALVLALLRPRRVRVAASAFAVAAATATVANLVGFMADPNASPAKWVVGGNEIALAIVGLIVLVRGSRRARIAAAGALGLLGLIAGLGELAVFTHGIVLSALPDTLVRALVTVMISAGLGATATAASLIASEARVS
jgi:hypothetical protein